VRKQNAESMLTFRCAGLIYLFSFLCTLEKFGAAFIGVREGEAEL